MAEPLGWILHSQHAHHVAHGSLRSVIRLTCMHICAPSLCTHLAMGARTATSASSFDQPPSLHKAWGRVPNAALLTDRLIGILAAVVLSSLILLGLSIYYYQYS